MKRLMLAPLIMAMASMTACVLDDDPEIVTVPATTPDPVVVPVPTPVPGPPGEKGDKGDTGAQGEKGDTGDTVVPVIVEEKDGQTADEGDH